MADQVSIQLPKTIVDERSQLVVPVNFRTRASAAASVPTTVEYKLYNLDTKETIIDWTSVVAAAAVTITIPGTATLIKEHYHRMERYELLVAADRGLATQAMGHAAIKVRNVGGHEEQ